MRILYVKNPEEKVKPEHGLSIHIELKNTSVLFDVGQSDQFAKNAEILGIDLSKVEILVISHGHFDHGGGLRTFFELNDQAKVYMHREAVKEHYTKIFGLFPYKIGLDKRIVKEFSNRIIYIDDNFSIEEDCILITDFPGHFPQPTGNLSLYEKEGSRKVHDSFKHEIALLINENNHSTLFTGCSHSGIVNMIAKSQEENDGSKIDYVFGGFHTHNPISKKNESQVYLNNLSVEMEKTGSIFYTGHCTGKTNLEYLSGLLVNKIKPMNTGDRIEI